MTISDQQNQKVNVRQQYDDSIITYIPHNGGKNTCYSASYIHLTNIIQYTKSLKVGTPQALKLSIYMHFNK